MHALVLAHSVLATLTRTFQESCPFSLWGEPRRYVTVVLWLLLNYDFDSTVLYVGPLRHVFKGLKLVSYSFGEFLSHIVSRISTCIIGSKAMLGVL